MQCGWTLTLDWVLRGVCDVRRVQGECSVWLCYLILGMPVIVLRLMNY